MIRCCLVNMDGVKYGMLDGVKQRVIGNLLEVMSLPKVLTLNGEIVYPVSTLTDFCNMFCYVMECIFVDDDVEIIIF